MRSTSRHHYGFRDGRLLPICTLYLLGPGGTEGQPRTPIEALVDSGAAESVFHASAAEAVGIELPIAPNATVGYGASTVAGWRTRVRLELRGEQWNCAVIFVEKLAFSYSLLGRRGVFARVREVTFVEQQRPHFVEFRV